MRMRDRACVALAGCLFGFVLPSAAALLHAVSVLSPGQSPPAGGNGDSCLPVISEDGCFVLFASTANNLVVTSNGIPIPVLIPARFNVFLRDRTNQTTTLLSVRVTGNGGGNGDSFPVAISTNLRYALFESSASDLVVNDTNRVTDVFLHDLSHHTNSLVSVNTNGLAGNGASRGAVMTPDGRYVAFVSEASDLVAGDTNRIADVFVRDMQAGVTALVSAGAMSTNFSLASLLPASSSESPQITPDGRFVAFSSTATNLVPGVSTIGEVYVRDLQTGTTVWASSGMRAQLQAVTGKTNGVCYNLALSGDGKFVAYQASLSPLPAAVFSGIILRYSLATALTDLVHTNVPASPPSPENTRNLDIAADGHLLALVANTNGIQGATTCIQVWDAAIGSASLVSGDLSGVVPSNSISSHLVLSASGRYVAFISNAGGLTTNAVPAGWHAYLRDLQTGTTWLVDADPDGAGSSVTANTVPRIADDARLVAFEGPDGTLVAHDNNYCLDVFVRDLASATNELISPCHPALASTTPAGASTATAFSASADGRYVAFATDAEHLVPGDSNGFRDVIVRDLASGTNLLVSATTDGFSGQGVSTEPAISGDGRYVAFTSSATNLAVGDTNGVTDVFVRDLQTATTVLASRKASGAGPGDKASYSPSLSTDGRWLLFRSQATDLAPGTFTGENLFLRDLSSGTNWGLTTASFGDYGAAAMTPDGRYVAFLGSIPNVITPYVYVWDSALKVRVFTNATAGIMALALSSNGNRLAYATAGALRMVDLAAQTNWLVSSLAAPLRGVPCFSADGRWLTYARYVSPWYQTFVYDVGQRVERLVSHGVNSAAGAGGRSDEPVLGPDGRFVAYRSSATNLVAGANLTARQIILYDRQTGANTLVTASRFTGGAADDYSIRCAFSADGQALLIQSWASDLTPGDFNRSGEVFAHTIFTIALSLSTTPQQGPWLSWPAPPGNSHRVQFKDALNDILWQDLPGSPTNLGVKAWLQDLTPVSTQRIYRVIAY